ncbi:MAG: hypothetical protein ACLPKI_26655 [Streptosporangiaceae bacterium]
MVLDEHPLAAMIFVVWTGVPLWLVLKRPDTGAQPHVTDTPRPAQVAELPALEAGHAYRPQHASGSRVLARGRS